MGADLGTCQGPGLSFVRNKRISAGAELSLATRIIVMEPNSEIGASKAVAMSMNPVTGEVQGHDFSTAMRQKIEAHDRAFVRIRCDQNGHPHALAEGMVAS